MHQLTKSIIKHIIDKNSSKTNRGRPLKEPIDHYLDTVFYVLRTGIPWASLTGIPLHWSTYHKKFMLWCNNKIFEKAHSSVLNLLNYKKQLDHADIKELYIDSSMIKNIQGVEMLGRNHYDRNRFGNKITLIVTQTGIPLSVTLDKANCHDSQLVETAVANSKICITGSHLIGDKGYNSCALKDSLKKNHKITLVYPYKQNQTETNTLYEMSLLKKRHIIENVFSWLKNYRRLRLRYDKKKDTFLQFAYLACLNIISVKIQTL